MHWLGALPCLFQPRSFLIHNLRVPLRRVPLLSMTRMHFLRRRLRSCICWRCNVGPRPFAMSGHTRGSPLMSSAMARQRQLLAKAAAKALLSTALPDTLWQAQEQQVLPWLWTALGVSLDCCPGCCQGCRPFYGACLEPGAAFQLYQTGGVGRAGFPHCHLQCSVPLFHGPARICCSANAAARWRSEWLARDQTRAHGSPRHRAFLCAIEPCSSGAARGAGLVCPQYPDWMGWPVPLFWDPKAFSILEQSRALCALWCLWVTVPLPRTRSRSGDLGGRASPRLCARPRPPASR